MTCRELTDFILDYVAGELPVALAEAFDRHLGACRNCQAYLDTYRATLAASRALDRDTVLSPMPEDLVQAILAARGQG